MKISPEAIEVLVELDNLLQHEIPEGPAMMHKHKAARLAIIQNAINSSVRSCSNCLYNAVEAPGRPCMDCENDSEWKAQ